MSEFRVKAGWPDGSVAEQSVMAADIGTARLEVERRGGHVFEIKRRGFSLARGSTKRRRGRVKMAEFLIFNQELIALLKAGLPVVRSFEILLERQKSPVLRRVLTDVRERVNSGSSISEAFAEEGDLFPRLYWTSLKAGEKSGEIEAVLRRYLKYQKTVIALTAQGRVDAGLPGHPDRSLGRPDHDPDDLRHPAVHRVLRRLRRRAAAADRRRPRHRHFLRHNILVDRSAPSASRASCSTAGSRRRRAAVWLDGSC